MTNDAIVKRELPDDSRCLWQITPTELPRDVPGMALELWQTPEGKLVLFQLFTDRRRHDWYQRVAGYVRYDQQSSA